MNARSKPKPLTGPELSVIEKRSKKSAPSGAVARLVATIRDLERDRNRWRAFQRARPGTAKMDVHFQSRRHAPSAEDLFGIGFIRPAALVRTAQAHPECS